MATQSTRDALLADLAALDDDTLAGLVALAARANAPTLDEGYVGQLAAVAASDVEGLVAAARSYGDSWKRRGGVDAFISLARKWDRLEQRLKTSTAHASAYDIFAHIAADGAATGVIDDVRDLRRYLMLVEAEMITRRAEGCADSGLGFLQRLQAIAQADVALLLSKQASYGASWKRRGGVGAFLMLARKWDRLEKRVTSALPPHADAPGASQNNIFEHIEADRRDEPVLDDIADLRRFFLLVEAEMAARGAIAIGSARDNRDAGA